MPFKIEKIEDTDNICDHPDHSPPMYISIPAGHRLVHECPQCGRVTICYGQTYHLNFDCYKQSENGDVKY